MCASGALATLIPPSIIMIVYGLSANVAIGDLFMAGAVPGLMLATFYAIFTLIRCYINPSLAPNAEEVAAARGKEMKLNKDETVDEVSISPVIDIKDIMAKDVKANEIRALFENLE